MFTSRRTALISMLAWPMCVVIAGCVVSMGAPSIRTVAPQQAERLYNIMTPLLRSMDHPRTPKEVYVGIVDDPQVNAANAGGSQFYVTTGLLEKASNEELLGIMAHEIAHEDLGHVARLQILGAGLNLGVILLDQLFPGSSAVTPIAGTLIARGYSRSEEYAADRHAVEILQRAGYPKEVMIHAPQWVKQASGRRGGWFSFYPSCH